MPLFDKIKKSKPEKDAAGDEPQRRKPRRENEKLSSTLDESAPAGALDLLGANERFLRDDSHTAIAALLYTEEAPIGGLSKKASSGNADKGSIIELIRGDLIKTFTTADMLEAGVLGIIPDEMTIDRMNDYTMLVNAPYVLCSIDLDTRSHLLATEIGPVSFADLRSVAEGRVSVDTLLPSGLSTPSTDEERPDEPDTEVVSPVADDEGEDLSLDDEDPFAVDEAAALADEGFDEDDLPADFDDDDLLDDSGDDVDDDDDRLDSIGSVVYEEISDDLGGDDEDLVEVDDRVIDEAQVRDSIARRFLSDDLELVVDMTPFDEFFDADEQVEFPEVEGDGWLNDQLKQYAAQANAELLRLRQDNRAALRRSYIAMMSAHIESVMQKVSVRDENQTFYSELMANAKADHDKRTADMAADVAKERRELAERFTAAMEARAEQAAAAAREQYRNRNEARHERQMAEVEGRRVAHDEQLLVDVKAHIMDLRAADAEILLEKGVTQSLRLLTEAHAEATEAEARLQREWSERMSAFIDENRKNEVARIEALQDQLVRDNSLEQAEKAAAARLAELRAELEGRLAEADMRLDAAHKQAAQRLRETERAWEERVGVERTKAEGLLADRDRKISALEAKILDVDLVKEGDYEARIAAAEHEAEEAKAALDLSLRNERVGKPLTVVLMIVMAVMGILAGFILGVVVLGSKVTATSAGAAILWLSGAPGLGG